MRVWDREGAGVGIDVLSDTDSDEVEVKATRTSPRDSGLPIGSGRQVEPESCRCPALRL